MGNSVRKNQSMQNCKFTPGISLPEIELPQLSGARAKIGAIGTSGNWKLIVIYRGAHCPLCAGYLKTLNAMFEDFLSDEMEVLALSADSQSAAQGFADKNGLSLPIAYGLTPRQMGLLGLYISEPISGGDADHPYPEPGLFVLNALGKVHIVALSNTPVVRPDLQELRRNLQYIRLPGDQRHDGFGGASYPIRGTYIPSSS
jgi:peroxiredoxin